MHPTKTLNSLKIKVEAKERWFVVCRPMRWQPPTCYVFHERKKKSTRRHDSFRHNACIICSAKHKHEMPTQYEQQHGIVSKWFFITLIFICFNAGIEFSGNINYFNHENEIFLQICFNFFANELIYFFSSS